MLQSIERWMNRGCRRIFGLDGCILKGKVKGELLAEVGRDGYNHLHPIAWAVVDIENKDNWKWFIELLSEDLGLNEGMELSIISDQHKGLIEAVKEVLPHAEHRQCARHMYAYNLRKAYSAEDIRKLFWQAAKSTVEVQFMKHMNAIKAISVGAYEHLMSRNPKSWCRAFFASGRASDTVENGMSESFNSVIDKARKKSIIMMLEEIRLYMMKRFYTMSKLHETWDGEICPSVLKKMATFKRSLRYWTVFPSGGNCFEVRSGFEAYKVDIEGQCCTCRAWELCGYPCLHAYATFHSFHTSAESKVSSHFQKSKFVEAYKDNILPLNGSNMWEVTSYTKPLPPKDRRLRGRPSVKRKRHVSEKNDKYPTGRVITCKNCFEIGHNSRSCKNPKQVQSPQGKKKKGRARTVDESERRSRGGRSGRGARGGGRGSTRASYSNIQQENMHNPVREETQKTEETLEVPMSMDQDLEIDVEVVCETQTNNDKILEDLRKSGYREDEIANWVAAELDEDGDEEGIDDTQPVRDSLRD